MPPTNHQHDDLCDHAENYMNRIRGFLDGLLNWSVTWNIALLGSAIYPLLQKDGAVLGQTEVASLTGFVLNLFVARMYVDQKRVSDQLIAPNGPIPQFSGEDQGKGGGAVWSAMRALFFTVQSVYLALLIFQIFRLFCTRASA